MTEKTAKYLTAGTLVHFTSGEYSSYSLLDSFVALQDLSWEDAHSIAQAVTNAKNQAKARDGRYIGDVQADFMAALIRYGFILSVNSTERHIGEYDSLVLEE